MRLQDTIRYAFIYITINKKQTDLFYRFMELRLFDQSDLDK